MNNELNLCYTCNVMKDITEFHKNNKMIKGRVNQCKKCHYNRLQIDRADPNKRDRFLYYYRSNSMFRRYGINVEQYEDLVNKQNNKCLICENEPVKNGVKQNQSLHIDHCHKTGKIRGLLCHLCNRAIGLFRERSDIIQKALIYLDEHS